jgi:hypothetical protein
VGGVQLLQRESSSAFSSAVDAAEAAAAGGAGTSAVGGLRGTAGLRQQQQQGEGPKGSVAGTAEGWVSARTSGAGGWDAGGRCWCVWSAAGV